MLGAVAVVRRTTGPGLLGGPAMSCMGVSTRAAGLGLTGAPGLGEGLW